jgi:pimeloyl-ACP methyl ester carboxylesterase
MPTGNKPDIPSFKVNIPDDTLIDLKCRLNATRWSSDLDNEDEFYGLSTRYLRGLVDYWANGFDWRAAERKINEFAHHRVVIDGVPVHFIREPGKGPKPIPIIISHGWPWTFWDLSKIIRPLTDPAAFGGDPADAFEVIVPSLTGFGFSTPLQRGDMNFWKMAEIWLSLMTKTLGHAKFAASGSDYGALVTSQLGHKYAEHLHGIHLSSTIPLNIFQGERPWDLTGGDSIVSAHLRISRRSSHSRWADRHPRAQRLSCRNARVDIAALEALERQEREFRRGVSPRPYPHQRDNLLG